MRFRSFILTVIIIVLGASVILISRGVPGKAQDDEADIFPAGDKSVCLGCHSENVDEKHFEASAHGHLTCSDCHQGIDRYPHPENSVKKPLCKACHGSKVDEMSHSVHRKAGGPSCQTCHGSKSHEIVKLSALPAARKSEMCNTCHAAKAKALAKSIHGMKAQKAGASMPTCLSCHGGNPHAVKSPASMGKDLVVSPCKNCHNDIADQLAGSAHGLSGKGSASQLTCLNCHGGDPHALKPPAKTTANRLQDASCRKCHTNVASKLAGSAHGTEGKHLSCLACHGNNPHAVVPPKHLSHDEKISLCEKCHQSSTQRLINSAHGTLAGKNGQRLNCYSCHGEDQHAVTPPSKIQPLQKSASCEACHPAVKEKFKSSIHAKVTGDNGQLVSCLICHESNPKLIAPSVNATREQKEAPCLRCHEDHGGPPEKDVHRRPDKQPGDHPTCLSCHGMNPHDLKPHNPLDGVQRNELCAKCHADPQLQKRYDLFPDTVEAYEATFHGKALMKMGIKDAANCTDCHGLHTILSHKDPDAPISPKNAPALCAKCHEGNTMDFAYSYAGHFRLGVEKSLISPLEKLIYIGMVAGCFFGLCLVLVLGIHNRVRPGGFWSSAAMIEFYDALSIFGFIMGSTVLLVAVSLRLSSVPGAEWPAYTSIAVLIMAIIATVAKRFVFPKRAK